MHDTAECLAAPRRRHRPAAPRARRARPGPRPRATGRRSRRRCPPFEWRPYVDGGFEVRERLHLLGHDLLDLEPPAPAPHRRATRRDRPTCSPSTTPPSSRSGASMPTRLDDAVRATPSTRFRIARDGRAYALVGRAGDRGYVQRLAVHPDDQGQGARHRDSCSTGCGGCGGGGCTRRWSTPRRATSGPWPCTSGSDSAPAGRPRRAAGRPRLMTRSVPAAPLRSRPCSPCSPPACSPSACSPPACSPSAPLSQPRRARPIPRRRSSSSTAARGWPPTAS